MIDPELEDGMARSPGDHPDEWRAFRRGLRGAFGLWVAVLLVTRPLARGEAGFVSPWAGTFALGFLVMVVAAVAVTEGALRRRRWAFAKGWFAASGLAALVSFVMCGVLAS